jgi:hypothetical protein
MRRSHSGLALGKLPNQSSVKSVMAPLVFCDKREKQGYGAADGRAATTSSPPVLVKYTLHPLLTHVCRFPFRLACIFSLASLLPERRDYTTTAQNV